ncbi:MAG: PilZ domain-containing protein [Spirochaetota bacterium]
MTPSVQRFFEQISSAYRTSPFEVILVLLMILGLMAGLVVYAMYWSRRERRHQEELSRRLFEEKASQLSLTPSQRELLERMRRYLKDESQIHQLVTDEVAFNAAAARLRENGEANAQTIAALRVTLGFHAGRTDRAPRSSTSIPEGATVLIARNRYRKPMKAKVLAPQPDAFRVRLIEEGSRLPPGAGVDVFFQSNAGVFTFHTTVLAEHGSEARLSHSEDLKKYQKRKYYRRRIEIPVHVFPFDSEQPLLSKSRDIGGGGASLVNPEGHFKVGDDLELRFRPDDTEIRVTGTVVRVSDSGKTIHVNYEHIRDSLRDRIYNAIFKPPRDELDEMERQGRAGAQGAKTSE